MVVPLTPSILEEGIVQEGVVDIDLIIRLFMLKAGEVSDTDKCGDDVGLRE
jgi:hypothetical protein